MRYLSIVFSVWAASLCAQHLTYNEWLLRAMADKRLQPCYGEQEKTAEQQQSDAEFLALAMAEDSVPRSVSDKLVDHGAQLLKNGEFPAAMMRFNQAWLVDSSSSRPFWGFGTFFMLLDRPAVAFQWYKRGLDLDSANVQLLDAMAVALLAEHHGTDAASTDRRNDLASAALSLAQRANAIDPDNGAVVYRLSICHLLRGECDEALRFSKRCKMLPSCPMESGFMERLRRECP
ncbi:MAG TPA: hypothetical protein PKY96_02480 [Flavobacteriales bacterium]|nr:hypothetical protein [Flavobacteriales bacterium]